jgi:hypothetical protein
MYAFLGPKFVRGGVSLKKNLQMHISRNDISPVSSPRKSALACWLRLLFRGFLF